MALLLQSGCSSQSEKDVWFHEEMGMSVSVVFPEELLVASREDREQFIREVTIYTLGHLYRQGKISAGLGARILGCDRWEFYRLLTEYGFSVIDYPAEEQDYEARTSREIAAQVKRA
jgi:predicted HTH domain antitoxin